MSSVDTTDLVIGAILQHARSEELVKIVQVTSGYYGTASQRIAIQRLKPSGKPCSTWLTWCPADQLLWNTRWQLVRLSE